MEVGQAWDGPPGSWGRKGHPSCQCDWHLQSIMPWFFYLFYLSSMLLQYPASRSWCQGTKALLSRAPCPPHPNYAMLEGFAFWCTVIYLLHHLWGEPPVRWFLPLSDKDQGVHNPKQNSQPEVPSGHQDWEQFTFPNSQVLYLPFQRPLLCSGCPALCFAVLCPIHSVWICLEFYHLLQMLEPAMS